MKKILFVIFSLMILTVKAASVYTVKTVPNDQLNDAHDYVTNPDGIISADAEFKLNSLIQSIKDSTSAEIAVVLLHSIGDEDIDNFATDLFTNWGIGKNNDNGLLFLLVYDIKEMVFRTGYGLEGVLPDIILSRVIRNDISPRLKEGDFDSGVFTGIDRVYYFLMNPEAVDEIRSSDNNQSVWGNNGAGSPFVFYLLLCFIIFSLFAIYFIYVSFSKKSNYQKYTSFNSKGLKALLILFTIFFPVFMILVAICYPFLKKMMRNRPIRCSKCNNKMHRLNESEEDRYLNKGQQTEELVKSVDYDVWLCDSCGNKEILSYNKSLSPYALCPNCRCKTYIMQNDQIVSRATTRSAGAGERTYICKNCGFTDKKRYIIPIIIASSGGGRSSGGGFGGGSFGGGGSWGGGSTGGGGARGGW